MGQINAIRPGSGRAPLRGPARTSSLCAIPVASALKALARIMALMMLMAVAVGSSRGSAVDQADLEAPTVTVLGEGSCGFEDDDDQLVVCGREILGGLVDTSWLVMPEGQCTDLLAQLFDGQTCALTDPDCQRASPGTPAPASPKLQTSTSPTPTLARDDDDARARVRGAWPPAVDDDVPASLTLSPPERPPQAALA